MPVLNLDPVVATKITVFIAAAIGILILIIYRLLVAHELEPLPVALTMFGLVETIVLTFGRNEAPPWGGVTLTLFVVLAFAIVVVFLQQERLTRDRVKEVLEDPNFFAPGRSPNDPSTYMEIQKVWVRVGYAMVDVDIFPNNLMERVLGSREERRKAFVAVLPDDLYDKNKLTPDKLLVPEEKVRGLRFVYSLIVIGSLGDLLLLVAFAA